MQIFRPSILCVCVEWADKVICSRSCWNVSRLIAGIIITGLLLQGKGSLAEEVR